MIKRKQDKKEKKNIFLGTKTQIIKNNLKMAAAEKKGLNSLES